MKDKKTYKFAIGNDWLDGQRKYFYVIFDITFMGKDTFTNKKIHGYDYFETEQRARFAAIGHITLLENGDK